MKKHHRNRSGKPDRVSAHEDRRRPRFSRELSVLYEDDSVVVLDKPAGLLAVPIKGSDTPSAWSLLAEKLEPERHYLVALRGRIETEAATLVHYFRREGMYQQLRTARDPAASRAELRYTVERLFADASLVRVELVTGLQNQIRVQFAALGPPAIGDRKYHRVEASERLIDRVALHAAHLKFLHPRSGKNVSVDCKLPPDFQHLVRELSRSSRARR